MDSALIDNGPQGIAREPNTRMTVEHEALHLDPFYLWKVSDLVDRPYLYEPVGFNSSSYI